MRKAAAVLVMAALAVAACGKSGDRPAATVNDVIITDDDVVTELNAVAANRDFVNSAESGGNKIRGTTPGSFDPGFAANLLVGQITSELVRQEVVRRNLEITDECRAKTRNNTMVNLGGGSAADGEAIFNKFPASYQQSILERQTDVNVLQGDLAQQPCGTGESAAEYYTNHQDEFAQTCLSGIIVDDPALATDIANRARAGEDFGALVQQYSTDEQSRASGGDLGCALPNELPQEISSVIVDAATGDVTDPVETSIGQVVFKIGTKDVASFDEVQTQAEELADQDLGRAFQAWLQGAQNEATISVDRRYGEFDKETFSITPPASNTTVTPPPTSVAPP